MSKRGRFMSRPSSPGWVSPVPAAPAVVAVNRMHPAPVGPAAIPGPVPAVPVGLEAEAAPAEPHEMQGRTGRWQAPGWQPMSSAPKDGREIWITGGGMIRPVRWVGADTATSNAGFWCDVWLTAGGPEPRKLMVEPTAWRDGEKERGRPKLA